MGSSARLKGMQRLRRRRTLARPARLLLFAVQVIFVPAFTLGLALLIGCASPGPPRAPSLQLPRLVSDLAATRAGEVVTLHFTVPSRTTDGQPLRAATVAGSLCRQSAVNEPCTPVDVAETRTPLSVPHTTDAAAVVWTDVLPPALRSGSPRVISYRVALRNEAGRSAGPSDPVYAAAGAAPPAVAGLSAQGTRLGVELAWQPVPGAGEVLLQRTDPAAVAASPRGGPAAVEGKGAVSTGKATAVRDRSPKPGRTAARPVKRENAPTPGVIWLQAAPGDRSSSRTMDTRVVDHATYQYLAVRRETVQIGGRTLELRSTPSAGVTIRWQDIYPPPVPTGLTALGYRVPASSKTEAPPAAVPAQQPYAVDLIWQPVDDTRLAGYLVYRQPLSARGEPAGPRDRLTAQPISAPGFHDATALPGVSYRYGVTAMDPNGNESGATETTTERGDLP